MKPQRCLTVPDAAFCQRVCQALIAGRELHGGPSLSFDPVRGCAIAAQVVDREAVGEFSPGLGLCAL